MPKLINKQCRIEIGYDYINRQKMLYVQEGGVKQYYGTLMQDKAGKFLEALKRWDEAGGNDGQD